MKDTSINKYAFRIIFILILILGTGIRTIHLDKHPLNIDEKITLQEVLGENATQVNPGMVLQSTIKRDGGNGILYTMALHYWCSMWGTSGPGLRSFSLLCGVLVILLSYSLGLEITQERKTALIMMGLCAFHAQSIGLSQIARPYEAGLLLTLASSILLLRLVKQEHFQKNTLLTYVLLISASLLTHYSTVYIFITHFLLLIFLYKPSVQNRNLFFIYLIIPAMLFFSWMYAYGFDGLKILSERNLKYIHLSGLDPDNMFYMKTGIYSIAAGWIQNLLYLSGNSLMDSGYHIRQLIPLLAIPLIIITNEWKVIRHSCSLNVLLLFFLTISSMIYASILSISSGHIIAFQHTYSSFSSPYFLLLFSMSIVSILNNRELKTKSLQGTVIMLHVFVLILSTTFILIK